jgi:hypothetical protein
MTLKTYRIWQDIVERGERSATAGQWFTQETCAGHMIDGTVKVHKTLDDALTYTNAIRTPSERA